MANAACPQAGNPARRPSLALFMSALGVHSRERTLLAVAGRMAGRGRAVDLVTVRPTPDLRRELPPGVALVDLEQWWPWLPWLGGSNKTRIYLSAPVLAAYLRRRRPEVLLSASIPPNLTALRARRWAGGDTAVVLRQSNVVHIPGSPRYERVPMRKRDRFIPRLYRGARAIVAVSEGVAENVHELTGFPRSRIHAIPNWNVAPEITTWAREPVDHPWLAPGRACPVVLAVGRLVPKKDYPTLLRAFAQVRERRPVRLIVLGRDGGERRRIESVARALGLAADVDLLGHVSNPFAYYARADCYVLSSIEEGMPNALVEAVACGCPAVSTDCPSGPAEILDGGAVGPLVPVGDSQALAQAILDTLAAAPPRDRLKAHGARFSQERTVQRYLEVIDLAAQGEGTPPARARQSA